MNGTVYFDKARGGNYFVNDVLPRNIAHRPVTSVRPLTVGAAMTSEFECLAPFNWSARRVLANLFLEYEFKACGWNERKTSCEIISTDLDYRRWRVTRDG